MTTCALQVRTDGGCVVVHALLAVTRTADDVEMPHAWDDGPNLPKPETVPERLPELPF